MASERVFDECTFGVMSKNAVRLAIVVLLFAACSSQRLASSPTSSVSPESSSSPSLSPSPLASESSLPQSPAASSSIPKPPPKAPSGPSFHGQITAIERSRLTHSWREGCPVGVENLRLLTLSFWGFDSQVHTGELVVHRDQAQNVLASMKKVFEARFPVQRMDLMDVFEGSDDRSMEANNTSAFNCRSVESRPGVWSQHAYGRAIDVNPIQNPYVSSSGEPDPPAGGQYVDRSKEGVGMIHSRGPVVKAFSSVGWEWGGYWSSSKDYQHFSSNGR